MYINVNRDDFSAALAIVKRGVEKRHTIPVLSNILLTATDGRLELVSTDMDKQTLVSLDCETAYTGAVTLPGHALADLVKGLPKGCTIELEAGEGTVGVQAGQLRLALQSLPADDFPRFESGIVRNSFAMPCPTLLDALNKVAFAISTEETRYYLNGVFMHFAEHDSTLRFVAIDGHRLAKVELPAPSGAEVIPGVIIPRLAVAELQKLLAKEKGDCEVKLFAPAEGASIGRISFSVGAATLTTKLIDGMFPDYARVIPTMNDKRLTVPTSAFVAALSRVSKVSSERGRTVKLSIDENRVVLSVDNPDMGSVSETLAAAVHCCDASIEIGFNARYLLDILAHVESKDGTTLVLLSDPGSPAILCAQDGAPMVGILMPLRT
jgi:DNA polymerase III subunit beta